MKNEVPKQLLYVVLGPSERLTWRSVLYVFKDITQIKSRTISLFLFFFSFLKQPYSWAVSTDALIL